MPAVLRIRKIAAADVDTVIALWNRCNLTRPWNDPDADILRARSGPNSAILVGENAGVIVASVMVGQDGHRGWIYYFAVDPGHQKNGFGVQMVRAAEEWLKAQGMDKLLLMVRPENEAAQGFYRSIGYEEEPRAVFGKWLSGPP